MEKRKSAGFTVDDDLWRRFKSKAADEGLPIGEMLVRFIGKYLEENGAAEPVKGKAAELRRSVVRKKLGTGRKGPRHALEVAVPEPLARYASRFGVEDPDENALREKVLDAVAEEYALHGEEKGWVGDNLAMLEWYNRGGI